MVNQEVNYTGCGIATFANAVGFKRFSNAKSWMEKNNCVKDNGFVTIPQMREAIEKKLNVNVTLHNSLTKCGNRALLFVVYSKNSNDRHWLYYYNGYYYDPILNNKKPTKKLNYKVTRVINING